MRVRLTLFLPKLLLTSKSTSHFKVESQRVRIENIIIPLNVFAAANELDINLICRRRGSFLSPALLLITVT